VLAAACRLLQARACAPSRRVVGSAAGERERSPFFLAPPIRSGAPATKVQQEFSQPALFVLRTLAEHGALGPRSHASGLPVITTPQCGSVIPRRASEGFLVPSATPKPCRSYRALLATGYGAWRRRLASGPRSYSCARLWRARAGGCGAIGAAERSLVAGLHASGYAVSNARFQARSRISKIWSAQKPGPTRDIPMGSAIEPAAPYRRQCALQRVLGTVPEQEIRCRTSCLEVSWGHLHRPWSARSESGLAPDVVLTVGWAIGYRQLPGRPRAPPHSWRF